jgi:PAS domain S-box-containing protein
MRSPLPGHQPKNLPQGALDTLLDTSPLPMWVEEAPTGRVLAVSERALDYFGGSAEHLPRGPTPAGRSAGLLRHERPDGTVLTLRLEARPIEVEGRPARLVVAIDASEEARALDESEARRRDLLAAAAEWVWEWDAALNVSHLSPEFAAATGLSPETFLGRRQEETAITAGAAASWSAHRATIDAQGRFRDFVFKVAAQDGKAIWLKIGGTPVFDAAARFCGYRGVGSNVTTEIEADLALRRREQRYAQFFNAAPVWFFEVDESYRLTYVSPNSERTLGMSLDDYRGRRLSETPGVTIDPEMGNKAAAAQKARQPYQDFVYARKRPDGATVWVNTSAAPVFDDEGNYRGYCGIARDVTAQVEAERALRERDRRYRSLFDTTQDWLWETDARNFLTYVSANFEALYGSPVSEMIGRRLGDMSNAKIDPVAGRASLAAIKAHQAFRDFVYNHKLPSGRTVWVRVSGIPIAGADGKFCGYWGVSKDITVEVEADRSLRESEAQFRKVLEAAADYYWEQDAAYRYSYFSPGYERLFGISVAASIGKRLSEIPDISIDPAMAKMALAAIKAKEPFRDFVFSRRMPDGQRSWFKSSGAAVVDRNGVFVGYRGVGADITKNVEIEAAARLAQQRLSEAVAHVTQPIVVFDAEDRAVAYNQAFADLHQEPGINTPVCQGASFGELAEWRLRYRFYAHGPDDTAVDLETLLAHHRSEEEHTYHLRDGRWMLIVYRRLPGGGTVGLWTDVTALKRAETERRVLERQMHHSQRLEALGTLAGGVAHEINNALVPVVALTKVVAHRLPEDSRERRNLETVMTGAERSRDLVKQILAFSRKEEAQPQRESVDVAAVLRGAMQLMRATLPASIRLEEEIVPVPPVLGDAGQLQQVIVNIVTNAAHAIGEGQGRITVRLAKDLSIAQLRLSIADTGCGMDEATLARIFEPFFTTKQVGEGTGLGLSVAHGIVKEHGGRIEVASQPGQGTRFDILLPLPRAAAGAAA